MMFRLLVAVVGFALVLPCAAAWAKPELKQLTAYPDACGMYVYLGSTKSPTVGLKGLVAFQGDFDEAAALQINLGKGLETLPLISKNPAYPEKIGDKVALTYEKGDARLHLNLELDSFCNGQKSLGEGCELQTLVGTMELKTLEGAKSYKVKANSGC